MVYLKPEFSKAEFQHLHWLQSIIQQWLESWLDTRESDSYSWLFKYFILFSYSDVQEGHLAGYKRSLISVQVTDLFAMHSYSPEGSNQGVSQQRSKPHTHHLQEKKKNRERKDFLRSFIIRWFHANWFSLSFERDFLKYCVFSHANMDTTEIAREYPSSRKDLLIWSLLGELLEWRHKSMRFSQMTVKESWWKAQMWTSHLSVKRRDKAKQMNSILGSFRVETPGSLTRPKSAKYKTHCQKKPKN